MRKFWLLIAAAFIACLILYIVGTGWMTRHTVRNSIAHARRQHDPDTVLADLATAQAAIQSHRRRVATLSFVLTNPNFQPTNALAYHIEQFQYVFQSMSRSQGFDSGTSVQFQNAIRQLMAYRVPSISVLSPGLEKTLGVLSAVLFILTIAVVGVRVFAGPD